MNGNNHPLKDDFTTLATGESKTYTHSEGDELLGVEQDKNLYPDKAYKGTLKLYREIGKAEGYERTRARSEQRPGAKNGLTFGALGVYFLRLAARVWHCRLIFLPFFLSYEQLPHTQLR